MSAPLALAPFYTLFNTTRGGDPAVVVVNAALRNFAQAAQFAWHLELRIECQVLHRNGMPTAEEGEVLSRLEDEVFAQIGADGNALFLSRVTCRAQRELAYRVHDAGAAHRVLSRRTNDVTPLREWSFRMEHDPEWQRAAQVLGLFERSLH